MSKFLKHFTGSVFRRKCLHREHTPACFIIVIVGLECYKCNLFDISVNDGLRQPVRSPLTLGADPQERICKAWATGSPGKQDIATVALTGLA